MVSHLVRLALLAAAVATVSVPVFAQLPVTSSSGLWVGSPLDDYVRLLQLSGEVGLSSRMLRPLEHEARTLSLSDSAAPSRNPWRSYYGGAQRADTARLSIALHDPLVRLASNSAVPYGGNDGAMWAGRGLSGLVTLGAVLRAGPLTVRIAPEYTWSQNQEFPLGALPGRAATASPFADPYVPNTIDLPQRFGDGAYSSASLGQSSIQLAGFGLRAGVSTENMWWGPGIESSILMSSAGPGFRHAFVGTDRALDVKIGKLEGLFTLGHLESSAFWRAGAVPDSVRTRWLGALGFTFEPRGAPGLYLGAMRVFQAHYPTGGLSVSDVAAVLQPFTKRSFFSEENPSGNDEKDQLISLFARWVMPASQFEVYGEFARNDHSVDLRDIVLEPGHASGYLLGAQKLFPQRRGFVRFNAEAVSLATGLTRLIRSSGSFYTHSRVRQGYTHRGQLLGASAGPGGLAQSARLDVYRPWGSVGGFIERREINRHHYFTVYTTRFNRHRHDVFMGSGARGTLVLGRVALEGSLLHQKEYNRYFVMRNDVSNIHLDVRMQVRLP